jgi:hypothetical protein
MARKAQWEDANVSTPWEYLKLGHGKKHPRIVFDSEDMTRDLKKMTVLGYDGIRSDGAQNSSPLQIGKNLP